MTPTPIVTPDEVFAVNKKIRWVALATDKGEVILNRMRPGVRSRTPQGVDEEFVTLGPLTMLGVAEKYSKYLEGVESVVVWYGLMAHVYARLGSQVIAASFEKDPLALVSFLDWLEGKQREITASKQETRNVVLG